MEENGQKPNKALDRFETTGRVAKCDIKFFVAFQHFHEYISVEQMKHSHTLNLT